MSGLHQDLRLVVFDAVDARTRHLTPLHGRWGLARWCHAVVHVMPNRIKPNQLENPFLFYLATAFVPLVIEGDVHPESEITRAFAILFLPMSTLLLAKIISDYAEVWFKSHHRMIRVVLDEFDQWQLEIHYDVTWTRRR